jgi:hypothetical protein
VDRFHVGIITQPFRQAIGTNPTHLQIPPPGNLPTRLTTPEPMARRKLLTD